MHIFLCSNTHEHTNAPNGKHQGHAVCSRISPQRYSRLEPSRQSFSLAHRVRGAQAISAGSDQLNAIWSARLFIRFQPILPIKPFSSTRFFIDKEVVFSISPQHFLKPSLGYAGINLWAFSPSAPATASSLNHFPADFIGHAVVALLACFLFPPPPAACFRFAAGRGGGFRCGGLRPAPTMYLKRT